MSGDRPRDTLAIQTELNRQALVELGKRLTELELKFVALESEAEDLRYFTANSLQRAKRLQGALKTLIVKHKQLKSQVEAEG